MRLENENDLNNKEQELLDLADNLEAEELITAQENDKNDEDIDEDDNLENWVDKLTALTPKEQEMLKYSIHPAKTVLVKVCHEDMNLVCH